MVGYRETKDLKLARVKKKVSKGDSRVVKLTSCTAVV